jgi:hypothetical protein
MLRGVWVPAVWDRPASAVLPSCSACGASPPGWFAGANNRRFKKQFSTGRRRQQGRRVFDVDQMQTAGGGRHAGVLSVQ